VCSEQQVEELRLEIRALQKIIADLEERFCQEHRICTDFMKRMSRNLEQKIIAFDALIVARDWFRVNADRVCTPAQMDRLLTDAIDAYLTAGKKYA